MSSHRQLLPILNALLVFEAAAGSNSFTQAGKQLGMAQPSVSRFIANLEHHLDTLLFDRKHKRLQLTPNGEKLYHATTSGLEQVRAACSEIMASADSRLLTVECTHGFAHMWLLSRIPSLMADLPGWKLRTISTEDGMQLTTSEADLAVRMGDGSWPPDESLLLFSEAVFPVCSPAFAEKHGLDLDQITAQDLLKLPLLIQDCGEFGWLDWAQWFARFDIEYSYPADMLPISNYALSLQAAMEGQGIALAWDQLADPFLSNYWLVEIDGLRVTTNKGYYLVFSPNCKIAEPVREWVSRVMV